MEMMKTTRCVLSQPVLATEETFLIISEEKRRQKLERPKVMQKMYEKSCHRYQVVPVRQYLEAPDNHIMSLPNYNLGTLGVVALSVPLTLNESISKIDLSGNDMGAPGVRALVEALKGNTSVTELDLSENKLQTAGAFALKEFLREHPVLQKLSLSGNGFKDDDSIIFGQVMRENQRLKQVNFSHNEFAETAGLQFRQVLTETENIESFNISWNHLRRKGAMDLLAGVKKNYGLKVLDVSFNGFAAEGAGVLANVLKKNRTLQEVDIRHNRLNDADVINIATKMDSNDALRVLKLADNHFTQVGAMALLTVLLNPDNVVALELLDLGNVCVNEEFDFIANQLKNARQNLTITYGRVLHINKKVTHLDSPESKDVNKEPNKTNNEKVERAQTMPNMNSSKNDVTTSDITNNVENETMFEDILLSNSVKYTTDSSDATNLVSVDNNSNQLKRLDDSGQYKSSRNQDKISGISNRNDSGTREVSNSKENRPSGEKVETDTNKDQTNSDPRNLFTLKREGHI